ncbi:Nrap protein [Saitoella complicata NRRL Y-17804]|uniref:U3 small nucleolar RNA-associated protein 22 n=1 Tax=Saitoella complicata (strain BCRC 22490 / CBS 7301 / JCM 7358 / NBRC 10748 / NRRL Y-17804) TaxID=698492 RepID=A0A0E9NEB7_SAICN|nr:Nrap protein [Saitoella complicata NRRL Y-17804]ODQ51450.1 Nrap protein [Saitoella complicata NRRL Y-17804]GAO48189.1 hypothetical protein G7K_2369-t1 [Saitoella complicata NRRL Y-17804]
MVDKRKREAVVIPGPAQKASRKETSAPESPRAFEDSEVSDFVEEDDDDDLLEDEGDDEDNEDAMDGVETAMVPTAGKSGRDAHFAPPSREEIQGLQETSELYKSNIFKLEIDELLSEVRLNLEKMKSVEKALHHLRNVIDSIPETTETSLLAFEENMSKKHKIQVPFCEPRPSADAQYKFSYRKPANINLVGSYALKTVIKQPEGFNVDVAITMPSEIFQDKDYLNHRYFYKRACYLASLAAGIRKADKKSAFNIEFANLNGDVRRPILVIRAGGDGSELDFTKAKCCIRLLPAIPDALFPASKLAPTRNCVRPSNAATDSKLPPTPTYNFSVLSDMTFFPHLTLLYARTKACAAFRDACTLGRIWLRQRGFGGDIQRGGFGSFEWSMLMAFLLQGGGPRNAPVLADGYSSYQLFKSTIQFLAKRDFVKEPAIMGNESDVVVEGGNFVDAKHHLDLFGKMSGASLKFLRDEAVLSFNLLNETAVDYFDALFLKRMDEPVLKYDLFFTVPVPSAHDKSYDATARLDCPDYAVHFSQRLHRILARALTDRVSLIAINGTRVDSWSIEASPKSDASAVQVGLLLDPQASRRLVDHGPAADDKQEAARFRSFWGEKSELRRFKDGSILESLVWSAKSVEERALVVQQIVSYIVKRHIGQAVADGINYKYLDFSRFINVPKQLKSLIYEQGEPFETFQPALFAFDRFVKDLNGMEDFPLSISTVLPASAALRYSTVLAPLPRKYSELPLVPAALSYVDVIDVVVQFESSGRWPDDLRAIQKTKVAFLLKMAEILENTAEGCSVRVGLENEDLDIANAGFLDVVYDNGYAFRARIQHDREMTLLERSLKGKAVFGKDKDNYQRALDQYRRFFLNTPRHTFAMQALCQQHPSLSSVVRVLKRWFNSHFLTCHVPEELIELIAASSFTESGSWSTPASTSTGFARCIAFLGGWDWRADPLIIDFDGSISGSMRTDILEKMAELRKQDPAMAHHAMFVATSYDLTESFWTRRQPTKLVAARITALARATLGQLMQATGPAQRIFATPTSDYNFLIHLNAECNPTAYKSVAVDAKSLLAGRTQQYKNTAANSIADVQVGFDPICRFLEEVQATYGDSLLLFYDGLGGSVVGGLWNPLVLGAKPFKVNLGFSAEPISEVAKDKKAKFVINKAAILAEIQRVGGDMIGSIEESN